MMHFKNRFIWRPTASITAAMVCCLLAVGPMQVSTSSAQEAVAAAVDAAPAAASDPAAGSTAAPKKAAPTKSPAIVLPEATTSNVSTSEELDTAAIDAAWDYSPYRVLVWIVSDDPTVNRQSLELPLKKYLDRDFAALWRVDIADAPVSINTAATRNIDDLSYDLISASDPVIAVKRDHPEAVRIRIAANVASTVKKVFGTKGRIDEVSRRAAAVGNETIDGVAPLLQTVDGDEVAVQKLWADKETEALLVSRGMAQTLEDPEAKLITPPIAGLVAKAVATYDKIFIVRIDHSRAPNQVSVVEMDTLMRHFGPTATGWSSDSQNLASVIGREVTRAFAPVVRIDDAGQQTVTGLIRAGGLIMDEDSPANIRVDDVLEPMTRKNDRNGKPILIGAIDWAYLYVIEPEIAAVRALPGTGLELGDSVLTIAETKIDTPQRIEKVLSQQEAGEKISIEVERGDANKKLSLDVGDAAPLGLQYFGFTAYERSGRLVVASVIRDSPADGLLRKGDTIVSIGKWKISSIDSLGRLIIANKPDQPIEFSIQRKSLNPDGSESSEARKEMLTPTDLSVRMRRKDRTVVMDYHAGRPGGLQGRKNNRTFRTALKVRPFGDQTMIRLHAKGDVDFPLIGYEVYQRELMSKDMTFVGRTDWNGRLNVAKTDDPLRLFYIKNGGAVLARLPTVPGLTAMEVADIGSDDMRLQAEAYIRGVQNAIIDLVAIRELFKARIRLRLTRGGEEEMKKAEDLMEALRNQPSNEKLASDMGKKQDMFVKEIGRNANQRAKVDQMFKITRDLLSKHISPKLIDELELDLIAAKKNGGKLPAEKADDDAEPAAAPPADSAE